jgi:hypothetical protein
MYKRQISEKNVGQMKLVDFYADKNCTYLKYVVRINKWMFGGGRGRGRGREKFVPRVLLYDYKQFNS